HDQTKANGTVVTLNGETGALPLIGTPLAMSEGAFQLRRPPPRLGADGEAVLTEAGYSAERIAALEHFLLMLHRTLRQRGSWRILVE
ncbi:MAG: hypothetical protein WAK54_00485, partial [Bradyrhizobium sp.]